MTERFRILLIEDVADDAELALLELRRAGLHADQRVVDSEKSFVGALREFAPDVILSDFSMPGFDGMSALVLAREMCPDTPFIFVSGTIGEEFAVRALKSGATDYVMKSNLVRLPAVVERALQEAKDRATRRKTERELEALDRHVAAQRPPATATLAGFVDFAFEVHRAYYRSRPAFAPST